MSSPSLEAVWEVVDALEKLGIGYHLGGSLASTVHGVPRQTRDADIVAELGVEQIGPFVAELRGTFYVEPEMVREAVERRASFNLVHLEDGFKVDVFVAGMGSFDRSEIERASQLQVVDEPRRVAWVKSAEDTILRKLQWYESGGRVSDRQWSDVLGVLRVQGDAIDLSYLERWAAELGLEELLERALAAG